VGPGSRVLSWWRAAGRAFPGAESVDGFIAEVMRGSHGFGYDPLFFYPPFGKTFGEVAHEDKDRVSHRGKAFARLREFLAGLREGDRA